MRVEVIYSCLQNIKLLNFYDSQYNYFFDSRKRELIPNLYNENTPAFSYFVLTSCFLFHIDDFFTFCIKNNDQLFKFQPRNIPLFIDFFKLLCNKKSFMNTLESVQKIYEKMPFYRNMRMSSIDFF